MFEIPATNPRSKSHNNGHQELSVAMKIRMRRALLNELKRHISDFGGVQTQENYCKTKTKNFNHTMLFKYMKCVPYEE